jgi:hypothetical protein
MIGDPRGEKCAENTVVMLVGYMRVSSESDRQITDLQRDALLRRCVDAGTLLEDHALAPRMIGWD